MMGVCGEIVDAWEVTMPFGDHPEFAKLFSALEGPTCAVCLLNNADPRNMDALVEVFEQTAKRGRCLVNGFCRVCREYKLVINPA